MIWDDSGDPTKYTIEEIPTDLVDKANELREKLIETAVEQDDDVMEKYLDGIEPEVEAIKSCIRKGTINLDFFPLIAVLVLKTKVCNWFLMR